MGNPLDGGADRAVTDDMRDRTRARAGRAAGETAAPTGQDRLVRALRVAVSLGTVLGFVGSLGVAAGASFVLVTEVLVGALDAAVRNRLVLAGLVVIPVASVLFVAMFDDADLVAPDWPGPHPPLVDAWLLVALVGTGGLAAFAATDWPEPVRLLGFWGLPLLAYLAVPLWVTRRCLRRPSWVLGALSMLSALLVVAAGAFTIAAGWVPDGELWAALVVAVVGTVAPLGLASASPGPDALAQRLAATLRQVGTVTVERGDE